MQFYSDLCASAKTRGAVGETAHGIDPRKRRNRPHLPELMLPSYSRVSRWSSP